MKHRIILPISAQIPETSRLLLGQLAQQFSFELLEHDSPIAGDLVLDPDDGQLKYKGHCDAPLFSFSLKDQWSFHQKKRYHLKSEPLARALGVKHITQLHFIDATCGTGRDLCLLLSFGVKKLTAYERHPVVYSLLRFQWEAFQQLHPEKELELVFGEVKELSDPQNSVIYFDPMYPEKKKKSSLSRKEMELFKVLVGEDVDGDDFLLRLKELAPKRLVAKRPLKARPWPLKPTESFCGKSTRYDLFV